MEHYLSHTNYPIWHVIQNDNGPVSITTDTNGMIKVLPPKNAAEVMAREREKKARTTLLMALLEDYLAKFHKMADAKEMWEAIKSGFSGNDESKKIQKYMLKQQFKGFIVSASEGLHEGYNRFQTLLSQLEIHGLDTLSFDDLFNNLRVFKRDVKGTTVSSSNIQNVASMSADNTSSTNDIQLVLIRPRWNVSIAIKWGILLETAELKGIKTVEEEMLGTMETKLEIMVEDMHIKMIQKLWLPLIERILTGLDMLRKMLRTMLFPPMTGNYIPFRPDVEIDYSKFTYGPKQTLVDESDSKPSEYASCESDSSVETTTSVPEPVENVLKVICEPKVWTDAPIIEDAVKGNWDNAVKASAGGILNHFGATTSTSSKGAKCIKTGMLSINILFFISERILDHLESSYITSRRLMSFITTYLSSFINFMIHLIFMIMLCFLKLLLSALRPPRLRTIHNHDNGVSFQLYELHASSFHYSNHLLSSHRKESSTRPLVRPRQSDNGTKFKNNELIEFCGLKGIKREYSNARTPQQNGVVERKNMTLIEAAKTMFADSFLTTTFWAEAFNTACYVLNKVLVTKPQNKTPYALLTVENQANKSVGPKEANNSAGTQANDDQGANSEEINLYDEHFVLPIWSAYSTIDKLEKHKRQEKEAKDVTRKETSHENQDANTNNTNLLNVVSTPISTTGPSRALNDGEPLYPDDPSMPHLKDIYASPTVQTRSKVNKKSKAHALICLLERKQLGLNGSTGTRRMKGEL
nr:ribonuclease H-like domain-containing protein [Tanacetum cinerariifolium]